MTKLESEQKIKELYKEIDNLRNQKESLKKQIIQNEIQNTLYTQWLKLNQQLLEKYLSQNLRIEINTGYQGYFEINSYLGENILTWADGYIDQEPNPIES